MKTYHHTQTTTSRRRLLAVLALLIMGLLWNPGEVKAQANADANAIFQAGTTGGTFGYRVRRIGANSASFSRNSSFVYYPASSIKVFEHFYAMALVQNGTWTLNKNTDPCSGSSNCSDATNSGNCTTNLQTLETTLEQMMVNSSNAATNSVQQEAGQEINPMDPNPAAVGRNAMNAWGSGTLGMTQTNLNTKFGCVGACGANPNTLTLLDLERLYTVLAGNSILDNNHRIQLKDLMLNESNNYFNTVVNEEAAATGRNGILPAFYAKLYYIYKAGSWTCGNGDRYITLGGLIQLPTYSGAYKRLYTFGAFVDAADAYTGGTTYDATVETLRPAIRAALLTWPGPFSPADDIAYAAGETQGLIGQFATSPGVIHLKAAYGALRNTEHAMSTVIDSQLVKKPVEDAEEAVVHLMNAATYIGPVDSTLPTVVQAAMDFVTDAEARMVASGDGSTFGIQCQQVSQYLADAKAYLAAGAYASAMGRLVLAADICELHTDWNYQGSRDFDRSVGFSPVLRIRKAAPAEAGSDVLQINAWPNPVKDMLNIRVDVPEGTPVTVEVFDLQGRKLTQVSCEEKAAQPEFQLSTKDMPAGVLVVKVTADELVAIEKIINQN